MGSTISRLYGPALVATGPATVYTVPANTTAYVDRIIVNNTTGSAATLTMSVGADAAATRVVAAYSIPATGAVPTVIYLGIPLTETEVVQLSSGTNNALSIVIAGKTFTAG